MNALMHIPIEVLKNIGTRITLFKHFEEKYSRQRFDLLKDTDRPFNIVKETLKYCDGSLDIENKVVLEIGPGNSLAIGLIFLACGAKKIYFVDRFKHLFWDEHDIAFHKKVLEKIEEKKFPFSALATKSVTFTRSGSINFDCDRIEYRFGDVASLPLDDCSIDCVFSNAVLEHVHSIKEAINKISRVTRPDGIGIHEIDLRDHFFRATPLRLLRYPDWLWNLMSWNRPGYTNRLRFSDYFDLFKQASFEIRKWIVTREYKENIDETKLNSKFKAYSQGELKKYWPFGFC
ncbi:hypothetical protein ES703_106691 [subsurface metagenome]